MTTAFGSRVWGAFAVAVIVAAGAANGQSVGGKIDYSGTLGPINRQRPLCLCLYADAQLLAGLGCGVYYTNPVDFMISPLNAVDYYAVAFVDVHLNERLDPDEPFEIYNDRAAPPADPIGGASHNMHVDFVFGDENLPNAPTPTAGESPSPTPSASPAAPSPSATSTAAPPSPSETSTSAPPPTPTASAAPSPTSTATVTAVVTEPPPLAGDCDNGGSVSINELVRAVAIALGTQALTTCPAADVDHDGAVRIGELIQAVNAALH